MDPTAICHNIPSEISDAVIDHVNREQGRKLRRKVLGACSLVCKSWLIRSRYHLFGLVFLKFQETKEFLAILDSPLATIAPFIRHFTFEGGYNDRQWATWEQGEWHRFVLPRLRVLSAIEVLTMRWINFAKLASDGQDIANFFGSFQKLKKLWFDRCEFGTIQQVAAALSSPILEDVSLDRLNMPTMGDTILAAPSGMKSLEINFPVGGADILTWFASCPVERLQLSNIELQHSLPITNYIRVLGPSLKHLEIGFWNSSFDTDSQGMPPC